jgi:hypothetical protein
MVRRARASLNLRRHLGWLVRDHEDRGTVMPAASSSCNQHEPGIGIMALSDEEQQALDEIERSFQRDDPTFAANVSFRHVRRHRTVLRVGVFLLGSVVLIAGLVGTATSILTGVLVSIAGILMMTAAAVTLRFRRARHPP